MLMHLFAKFTDSTFIIDYLLLAFVIDYLFFQKNEWWAM